MALTCRVEEPFTASQADARQIRTLQFGKLLEVSGVSSTWLPSKLRELLKKPKSEVYCLSSDAMARPEEA
jgi:hypothetical protein